MAAQFEPAIEAVLVHEGGYVCDPADPGGATNFGISLRLLKTLEPGASEQTIRQLTREQAVGLYRKLFWKYDCIESQQIATKLLDTAVNLGQDAAHRLLQVALGKLNLPVKVDGVFGKESAMAVNLADPEKLLQELRALQALRYAHLAAANPKLEKFLYGWMRRAVS